MTSWPGIRIGEASLRGRVGGRRDGSVGLGGSLGLFDDWMALDRRSPGCGWRARRPGLADLLEELEAFVRDSESLLGIEDRVDRVLGDGGELADGPGDVG